MKKIHLLVLISLFSFTAFSQVQQQESTNPAIDQRIVEVFGDQLQTILANDPHRLKALNAILFERHEIVEMPQTSDEKFPKLSSMPLYNYYNPALQHDAVFNRESFNILKYDLSFYASTDKIYRIDNTNFILIIHPQTKR